MQSMERIDTDIGSTPLADRPASYRAVCSGSCNTGNARLGAPLTARSGGETRTSLARPPRG